MAEPIFAPEVQAEIEALRDELWRNECLLVEAQTAKAAIVRRIAELEAVREGGAAVQ